MKIKTPLILTLVGTLALSACDGQYNSTDPNARTKTGAVAGAIIGAAIGASATEDSGAKAIIGAVAGGLVGGAIGSALDQQAADLASSIGNSRVSVTNMGSYLVVNMPDDLLFATDSATLRPDLASDLRAVGRNLLKYPRNDVQVIGHTDNSGAAAYNQDLSQRRASAVAAILAGEGVPYNRMSAIGRGEDQPVASNLTPQGRAQNRRVEIIIRPR